MHFGKFLKTIYQNGWTKYNTEVNFESEKNYCTTLKHYRLSSWKTILLFVMVHADIESGKMPSGTFEQSLHRLSVMFHLFHQSVKQKLKRVYWI